MFYPNHAGACLIVTIIGTVPSVILISWDNLLRQVHFWMLGGL